ncbi:thiamine pyrophosphate-dependent dehydrogenase E1 component subunit alpha [Kordiimonas pumila]|uniref:Thiamine pyrophosphate-dependent dehydrogenase E1 component subunit alpha n=1 Tax=Kordiimonas pumila TaxID=2161677 RepID=A0ABV7D5L7_9PROT|nr:thiamine pyrophosphate-dependent dehydrogenase E1 component subunit alpha [Kordiimonas pumila]
MADLENLYHQAAFIRAFEERIAAASDAGLCPGLVHLCCGAELVETSICQFLDSAKDQVTGSHRSHGLALAMGADPIAVAAEILGRARGLSGGRGGTQHLIAPESGFLCSTGIVGAQVPIALGAALSAKVRGTGGIAVSFFGDGAANQGAVLETLNMAVALKLPVLFVLENNGIGQTTSSEYASGGADLCARAASFGLRAEKMDGYDGAACLKIAKKLVAYVRAGHPAFIEASVPRLTGHYHSVGQEAGAAGGDPLELLGRMLAADKVTAIHTEAVHKASTVMTEALKSPGAAA